MSVEKVASQMWGNKEKHCFFHETTREQRSRHENWTTRIQIALRVFFIHMKFRISEPPEGAPKGAGDMDINRIRNLFKPNNIKSKMPNISPIVYSSPPLSVDSPTFELKLLLALIGDPHIGYILTPRVTFLTRSTR